MGLNFKFPSIGQQLDDAAVLTQTINGVSIKPLSPVNIRGERNQASDLWIPWARRSRIAAGMTPGADVPLGEEQAEFELEVYDGSDVVRTIQHIFLGMPMGAVLNASGTSKFDDITANSILVGGVGARRFASLQQITQGENFVEATFIATGVGIINFGVIETSKDWRAAAATDADYHVELDYDAASKILTANQGSTTLYSEDASAYFSTGVRIRLELGAGEVRFYKNYSGPGSPPIAISPAVPSYPFRAFVRITRTTGSAQVNDVMMTTYPQPGVVYTADQQTEDFGSPQSAVKVRVYQMSALIGKGDFAEATI